MRKEMFYDSLKNSKFTGSCMENHSRVTGWQELFFHTNPSNFRRKIYRLHIFEVLFQVVLTKCFKSELFTES